MALIDLHYEHLVREVLDIGTERSTRAGDVLGIFGESIRYDLSQGLPLLTTKKVAWKAALHELLWFLSGSTNIKYLLENNVHIWDDDAYRWYRHLIEEHNSISGRYGCHIKPFEKDEFLGRVRRGDEIELHQTDYRYGDLGNVYGYQWRYWGRDQIANIVKTLKDNPMDRRLILSAWNNADLDDMALPPCHVMYQFYAGKNRGGDMALSCMMTQRSADLLLGVPFNLFSTAVLTHMIAHVAGMAPGVMIWNVGDCHIYKNQIGENLYEQLRRSAYKYDAPKLAIDPSVKNMGDFKFEHFSVEGYESYPALKFPLSVG